LCITSERDMETNQKEPKAFIKNEEKAKIKTKTIK
jgi:hypothetical protein